MTPQAMDREKRRAEGNETGMGEGVDGWWLRVARSASGVELRGNGGTEYTYSANKKRQ